MSKKSKAAPVAASTLSKKERKALAAREAIIAAELERRRAEKKKAKKGGKKGKPPKRQHTDKPERVDAVNDAIAAHAAERDAKRAAKAERNAAAEPVVSNDQHVATVALVVAEGASTPEAVAKADAALDRLDTDKMDAEIKARVTARRADRDAAEARVADMQAAQEAGPIAETRERAAALKVEPKAEVAIAAGESADLDAHVEQIAEVVVTETGREFAVGTPAPVNELAQPSEAPATGDPWATNGNHQYLVKRPSDGKMVGYTRVTTYIGTNEDRTKLEEWRMRLLLEGVAAADEADSDNAPVSLRIRSLVAMRDETIAKARKADRKGKLAHGQLATIVDGAFGAFKKAMNVLADEVFEIGGGREKAAKGTEIHDLCHLAVTQGIDAVGEKLTAGEITPSDLADVEAFMDALRVMGAEVLEAERVIVNDELGVAGRLDLVLFVKLPGMARKTRVVADLKTGRVDFGQGKIAQQLSMYAEATGYDLDTHERTDLKLNRTKGLLIHLPAGSATVTVHVVDLGVGRVGNRLSGEVRSFRNDGKRAYDLKANALDEYRAATASA